MRIKNKIIFGFLLVLLAGNFLVWQEIFKLDNNLKVVFFDVGQGDTVFIRTPENHQIMIDSGPDQRKILQKLGKQMPFWDKSIDLIILTHPDYDHLNGFLSILEKYKIKNILWTGVLRDTKTFSRWIELLKQEKSQGANIIIAKKGQIIKAGNVLVYIEYPFISRENEKADSNSNDTSIVAKLVFNKNKFLFTGDIGARIKQELLRESNLPVELNAQVLKIAHHGSRFANSKEFLQAVSPEIAVISCGKNNRYGHPHKQTLDLLREFGVNVLRTDQLGDIKIVSNGSALFLR